MTDAGLKKLLGFLLRNKGTAVALLEHFRPEEVERGILAIPERLINRDIKMLIMDQAGEYLNDYALSFDQDAIFVDLDLNGKQLGRLKAKYMLKVTGFEFYGSTHRTRLFYQEDLRSEGNLMQAMAVKAAGLKGSYLQTALEMAKLSFIRAGKDNVSIDLDALEFMKKIPQELILEYISSRDGILKFKFHI